MNLPRLAIGLLLTAIVIATIVWLPEPAILTVLLLVSGLALWEFYALLDTARVPHFKLIGLGGGLLLMTAAWYDRAGPALDWAPTVFVAGVLLVAVRQLLRRDNPRPWEAIGCTLLGILYVPYLLSFFAPLIARWGLPAGRHLVFFLLLVVKLSDTGAYVVGCTFGRHKLLPQISPLKTWEGWVGGMLTGLAAGVICLALWDWKIGTALSFHWIDAIVLSLLLGAAGSIGDLIESLFKRTAGVKDSSRMLPGLGGLLDVLDSVLFATPILYLYLRLRCGVG